MKLIHLRSGITSVAWTIQQTVPREVSCHLNSSSTNCGEMDLCGSSNLLPIGTSRYLCNQITWSLWVRKENWVHLVLVDSSGLLRVGGRQQLFESKHPVILSGKNSLTYHLHWASSSAACRFNPPLRITFTAISYCWCCNVHSITRECFICRRPRCFDRFQLNVWHHVLCSTMLALCWSKWSCTQADSCVFVSLTVKVLSWLVILSKMIHFTLWYLFSDSIINFLTIKKSLGNLFLNRLPTQEAFGRVLWNWWRPI